MVKSGSSSETEEDERAALGLAKTAVLIDQVNEFVRETEEERQSRFPRFGEELRRVAVARIRCLLDGESPTVVIDDEGWSDEDEAFFRRAVAILGATSVYSRLACERCAEKGTYCACCCSCGGKKALAVQLA